MHLFRRKIQVDYAVILSPGFMKMYVSGSVVPEFGGLPSVSQRVLASLSKELKWGIGVVILLF